MTVAPTLPGLDEKAPHYVGHRERLRERFIANPDSLPDYEMLELLLATAIPRKDVKPIAKALMNRYGSFADVISADYHHLVLAEGLGPASAAVIKLVQEAALRLAKLSVMNQPVLSSWDALLDYCNAAMARLPTEQFRLLFLNHKNALIADELQQKGTVDHTPLYPREVIKRALALNASAIIMVHNHPSGDPTPSKADIEMTRAVRDALKAVSITLHDHLIMGRKGHTSFKSVGLL
ncbi:MAG: DNA repair protein RadC [Rhodospirillaceae bacterium]|nr:DNA repair protein RadC [Rhodospirillales bacterium]